MADKFCRFQCPVCGWWASEDFPGALVERTPPVYNASKAIKFGGEPLDWTETWKCPLDGAVFTFDNSNC